MRAPLASPVALVALLALAACAEPPTPAHDEAAPARADDGTRLAFAVHPCDAAGFCWEGKEPASARLVDVGVADDGVVWAAGGNELWRRDDGHWMSAQLGDGVRLVAVSVTASGDVWAAGNRYGSAPETRFDRGGPALFHVVGEAAVEVRIEIRETFADELVATDVYSSGPDDLWLATNLATFHFDGATWLKLLRGADAVGGAGRDDVFVATLDDGIVHFDGASFVPALPPVDGRLSAWNVAATPGDAWVAGLVSSGDGAQPGAALRFDGAAWHPVALPFGDEQIRHVAVRGDDVWALSFQQVAHLVDGAAGAWSLVELGRWSGLSAMAVGPSGVVAVGDGGMVLEQVDGALTATSTGGEGNFGALWTDPAGDDVYALRTSMPGTPDAAGFLVRRGGAWTVLDDGVILSVGDPVDLVGVSADDLWLVGRDRLRRFDGATLRDVDTPLDIEIDAFAAGLAVAKDDVWIVGARAFTAGRALRFRDGVLTSVAVPAGVGRLMAVDGVAAPDHSVFAVSLDGHVLRSDGGAFADLGAVAEDLYAVHAVADDDVWVAGHGALLHFDGEDFTPAPMPEGTNPRAFAATANELWLVCWEGAIGRLRDGTWTFDELAPALIESVAFARDGTAWLGGERGALLRHAPD